MKYDIIIIGGGMVGASLACALRSTQLNIALIDAAPSILQNDHRLIALNYGSYCLFKNIGIWEELNSHAAPIETVHVSHRGHFGITRLRAHEFKLPTLGYVVPAKYINEALYKNLNKITLIHSAKLSHLTQHNDHATITVETPDGQINLTGKKIIGADGSHSTVRELLGITTKQIDYQQSAIVTVTQLQRSHNNIAYERFQQQGAIAMLPLIGDQVATIWTDDNKIISHLLTLNDTEFLKVLQKNFGYRLGRFLEVKERYVYPLHRIYAEQQVKQNICIIGNAAHTLHPIAAQGLNLALYEVGILADYFTHCIDIETTLPQLNSPQQAISTKLSHYLKELFTKDFFLANKARQIGMLGFELFPILKEQFMQYTTGRSGKLPSLFKEQKKYESNSA